MSSVLHDECEMMDWIVNGCLIQVFDSFLGADAFSGSGDCVNGDRINSRLMSLLPVH